MKDRKKYVFYFIVCTLLIIVGSVIASKLNTRIEERKAAMNVYLSHLLEEAINKNAEEKTKNVYIHGIEQRPTLIGQTEMRTFCSADTTFVYQYKIIDATTALLETKQSFLLLADSFKTEDVQQLFDSLLLLKNIKVNSIIRVVSSGCLKKCTLQTGDTASMSIHGRGNYMMDDGLMKIEYTAYVHYPFFTLWRTIRKTELYYGLFLICIICLGLLFYKIHKRIEKKKLLAAIPIMRISNNYQDTEYPVIEDEYVRYNSKCVRFTRQTLQIMRLFLNAEEHRVSKSRIKNLWPNAVNQRSNMTTAINRTNKLLEEIDCPYSIITDATDKEYYRLSKNT